MEIESEMRLLKAEISVLMSVYNEESRDICKSIDSILQQTEKNFELIIVNDNPKREEYRALLSEWESKDGRIKILNNAENIGLAASMNKALSYATGSIIARMDADDYSVPTRFEKELRALHESGCDVVFSNYILIDENDAFLDQGKPACLYEEGQDMTEMIVFSGIVHHPTVMMKKEAIQRVNGYRLFPCSQDQDLWIRMLEAGSTFTYLNEVLLHYRVRQNSITQKRGYQQFVTIQYILHLFKERMEQNGTDSFTEEAYRQYIAEQCSNEKEMNRYDIAVRNLSDALKDKEAGQSYNRIVKRIKAFCVSKTMRDAYLFRVLNKKKMMTYLKKKQHANW